MLSWSKKRRRRIAREELIAHLCGKAVPASRMRASQSQFAKTPVKSTSTSALSRFASVDSVEPDLQLFHDALAVHGLSVCLVNFVSGSHSSKLGDYKTDGKMVVSTATVVCISFLSCISTSRTIVQGGTEKLDHLCL